MHTRKLSWSVACVLASGLLAQNVQIEVDFTAWLQQRYPVLDRATVADAVAAARQQGLVTTTAEHLQLKRALHALRARKDFAGCDRPMLREFPPASTPPVLTDNIVPEVEYNDGPEFATPMLVAPCGRGNNAVTNDLDFYSFLSTGEFITAEVVPQGATPIIDSSLGIKNQAGQMLAFNEDISGANYMSRTSIYLPAGIYQAEVGPWDSTGGGGYDLVLTRDTANLTPLAVGINNGATASPGSAQTVWTFTLAQESTVGIVVTGPGGGADLQLAVQLADGRLWFICDDANGGVLDPAADLDLPAGSYTLHVTDLTGAASAYTISYSATVAALADIGGGGVQSGSITGPESRRLYRLTHAAQGDVDLQTAGGPTPIGDTILYLYDSDLDFICDCDDANIANPNDYYARMQIGLPAGVYYVGVRGWDISAGDYTLAPFFGAFPAVGTVNYGRTNTAVAGGGRVSLATIDVCSATSVRLDSVGGVAATLYGFMTSTGQSLGIMEWSQDGTRLGQGGRARSRPTAGYLPRGTHYVLTWHRFEQSYTNMFLDVFPTLNCEGGSLVSHGKAGDFVFLFGDLFPGPGMPLASFGFEGHLCLPFGSPTLQTIGFAIYPPSGAVNWFACPSIVYGVYLQHGDLYAVPGPFLGAARDRRRL